MTAGTLDARATIRRMNELNHAMDAYLGDLARAGRTRDTRKKYQWLLWMFADFLEREGVIECDRITSDLCRRFLDRWVESSPSTMALHHTILTRFFKFLVDETVLEHSPMERIGRPRRKRPEDLDVVTVSSEDVEKLFRAADGWQEVLCLSVLAYMGVRRRAAANAKRRDVKLEQTEDGRWRGTIRFAEKGGKVAYKPIPDELVALIRAADQQHVWTSADEYLIPNRRTRRNRERDPKVIYDTVKKIADRAGVRAHVHSLRAAFAVRMDELYPGRLIAVKELLGHARVETTMVYLRRQDKTREMETVRGLTWGSVFPPLADVPPAGFEPAFQESADGDSDPAVTDGGSLPDVLLAKLLGERHEAKS